MALIADLLQDPGFDFHCLVDHPDNVAQLGAYFASRGLRLNVMIEYGVVGGRCGCRSEAEVLALAASIAAQPALALTGIEGYEGVIHGEQAIGGIRAFAESLVGLAVQLQDNGAFALARPIVTASGSAWYDLVAESFASRNAHGRFLSVLRPGSYVAHDHGIYKDAQCGVLDRRGDLQEGLRPALEVWAHVQSLPEPGFAVIALGKRDVAHDAGLPVPLRRYRVGVAGTTGDDVGACRVTAVMDQHAFMQVAPGLELRIGDIIAFGTSHPCLTFDKWRVACLVDAQLRVVEIMPTCF
jgi:D-serine dehydratase